MNKILDDDYTIAENLEEEEMEFIAYNQPLRYVYNDRWYRTDNHDTYFLLVNYHV